MTDRDRHGRSRGITVVSEIKPFRWPVNRLGFAVARVKPSTTGLQRVPLLHFVRFCLVRKIPYNGPPQPPERLRHPLLIFEDHYDGLTDPYIELFRTELPREIGLTWGTSYGYPGVDSVTEFTRKIKKLAFRAAHYYSAYPDATVTMIGSALEVSREHRFLQPAACRGGAAEFAAAYREFLIRRQGDL